MPTYLCLLLPHPVPRGLLYEEKIHVFTFAHLAVKEARAGEGPDDYASVTSQDGRLWLPGLLREITGDEGVIPACSSVGRNLREPSRILSCKMRKMDERALIS